MVGVGSGGCEHVGKRVGEGISKFAYIKYKANGEEHVVASEHECWGRGGHVCCGGGFHCPGGHWWWYLGEQ